MRYHKIRLDESRALKRLKKSKKYRIEQKLLFMTKYRLVTPWRITKTFCIIYIFFHTSIKIFLNCFFLVFVLIERI